MGKENFISLIRVVIIASGNLTSCYKFEICFFSKSFSISIGKRTSPPTHERGQGSIAKTQSIEVCKVLKVIVVVNPSCFALTVVHESRKNCPALPIHA